MFEKTFHFIASQKGNVTDEGDETYNAIFPWWQSVATGLLKELSKRNGADRVVIIHAGECVADTNGLGE